MTAIDHTAILRQIQADERYQRNVDFGKPRPGHPEGTVRAHIEQLEDNRTRLSERLSPEEQSRLRLLIHVHDTFKAEAQPGVAIVDPQSHASLAKAFLAEFCDDSTLLDIVQFHDEPFALWRQFRHRGEYSSRRFDALLATIADHDLFSAFLIIDGCTPGKDQAWLRWYFGEIADRLHPRFGADDLLPVQTG